MEGLAEWKLADGGWIQVFQDKERAGASSVTLLVSGLDDQLAELKAKGISIERTTAIRHHADAIAHFIIDLFIEQRATPAKDDEAGTA